MPFYGADEPRYAQIGQEMLENSDFITPTLGHRPWLEKPPLLYWMEAGSYALLGVCESAARLPNAILTLLAALAIGFLGWRITGEGWSSLFVIFGRAASTDMALTVPYSLMLITAFIALEEESLRWASLAGFFGALAVLAKGPIGVVLAVGTLFIYMLILRRFPAAKIIVGFTLVIAAVGLPWFILAWVANGDNFFLTFIVNHHIARFLTDLHHHSQPFWYYIPILLLGFFPWVFFLFPAARNFLKRKRDLTRPEFRLRLFLWIWALLPILFFSASSAKLPGYILPSFPPLALLVSLEWKRQQEEGLKSIPGRFIQLLLVVFALLLAVGFPLAARLEYGSFDIGLAAGIPLLAGIILSVWWSRKHLVASSFLALAGGMIISMSALFAVGAPVLGQYYSTAELVSSVDQQISARHPLVLYRFFHHTALYYSGGRITPDSLNSPQEMAAYVEKHPQVTYILLTTRRSLVPCMGRR